MKKLKMFKNSKTNNLILILKFILNYDGHPPIEDVKIKFKSKYLDVKKIIKDLPFIELINVRNSDNKVNKCFVVKDYSKLLNQIQSLNQIMTDKNHKSWQLLLGIYTLAMTLIVIMLSITQFSTGVIIGKEQINYQKLETKAELEVGRSIVNYSELGTHIDLCLFNKGGVESGKVSLSFIIDNQIEQDKIMDSIAPKSVLCSKFQIDQLFGTYNNLTLQYGCIACGYPETEDLAITN